MDEAKVSRLLVGHGYGVYPQAYDAAWHFVAMVDYPRHGYRTYGAFLKQVLRRFGYEVDEETLRKLGKMYYSAKWQLCSDAPRALKMAKSAGYKIGVVTTIAKFLTRAVLHPVVDEIDLHVDGFTYGCEKSNPRIYTKAMEDLGVGASETLMVGDGLELDVILPKRLGMRALLLDRNKRYGPTVRGADGIVRDLIEAVNFTGSLQM